MTPLPRTRPRITALIAASTVLLTSCSQTEPSASHDTAGSTPTTTASPRTSPPTETSPEPVPTGRKGTPKAGAINPHQVSGRDATAVAIAAVTTMYRQDTALDNSPADAARRATPWMTPSYAKAVSQPRPGGGGAQWLRWNRHRAYTTATVRPAGDYGAPTGTPTRTYRQLAVTVTPRGRDGWHGQQTHLAAFVSLSRPDRHSPWRISGVRIA